MDCESVTKYTMQGPMLSREDVSSVFRPSFSVRSLQGFDLSSNDVNSVDNIPIVYLNYALSCSTVLHKIPDHVEIDGLSFFSHSPSMSQTWGSTRQTLFPTSRKLTTDNGYVRSNSSVQLEGQICVNDLKDPIDGTTRDPQVSTHSVSVGIPGRSVTLLPVVLVNSIMAQCHLTITPDVF